MELTYFKIATVVFAAASVVYAFGRTFFLWRARRHLVQIMLEEATRDAHPSTREMLRVAIAQRNDQVLLSAIAQLERQLDELRDKKQVSRIERHMIHEALRNESEREDFVSHLVA